MNEVVIFCESYPQIKTTLYLATQNHPDYPVTIVVTGNHDLFKFFKLVNERIFRDLINVLYFDVYPARVAKTDNKFKKALYLLPDIVGEKRYLIDIYNTLFAQRRDAEVFFFSRYFNASTFYILKRLSKTNRLVYIPDPTYDVVSINNTAPINIIELLYLTKCKLVYGHDIVIGKHPLGQIITRIPDKFFKESVFRVISREKRNMLLQDFDMSRFRVFDVGDYEVMYFHEDLIEHGYIADAEVFEKMLIEVFNILGKYLPENKVARKYRAGSSEGRDMIQFGDTLPDFIPAECLYDEKVKVYIGLSSMALANVEKGLAVSLIDMVNFKEDRTREQLKEALIKWSHREILFPKSLTEFEGILINIKKKQRIT